MARQYFDLNIQPFAGYTVLVHGVRNAGKTFLGGDFLSYHSKKGPVKFVNILGEDGQRSAMSFDLGKVGETHESYDDFKLFCQEYQGKKLEAVFLDSMSALARWIMKYVVKSDRLPRVTKDSNEWGEFHREAEIAAMLFRNTAKYILAVCPSDRSVDAVTQQTYISPDLPGRQATGSAGWYDFVGYLQANTLGPGTISRKLMFTPSSTIVTRQRLAVQIDKDIEMPNGPGGWAIVDKLIEEHAQMRAKEKK